MINWGLLKHPLNWVTVILMLLFAAFAADQVAHFVQTSGDGQN